MTNNINCKNIEDCNSCNYCNYCNYCDYCDSCDSCDSCNSCNSCNYCDYCDYCDYSSGLRMSERMLFCLGEGGSYSKGAGYQKNNQIFNTQVTESEWNEANNSLPEIKILVTQWVDKKEMTKDEKDDNPVYKEIGGYLKRYDYKEAWANWWEQATQKDKQAILDLPHFDSEIFEGITGIKVDEIATTGIDLDEITINGKKYRAI